MRIVVAMTGASGSVYGVRLLSALKAAQVESDLIVTRAARRVMEMETDYRLDGVYALATHTHEPDDLTAPIASGQTKWDAMVVAPCSMHTLGCIASCDANNLVTRAADITLKERRRLILLVRETPLHLLHLRQMVAVTEAGAVVMPPVPAFYTKPRTLDDLVDATVGRVLDLVGVDHELATPWPPEVREA